MAATLGDPLHRSLADVRFVAFLTLWRASLASRITAVLDGTKRKTTDLEKRVKDEEGRISALQQEGVDLKQKLEEETTELDKARSVYQDWLTRNSEKALERRLREAMDEKEQESERLLREFDPASEDLGSFIQEYIALRKSYHELYYKHEYFAQPNA